MNTDPAAPYKEMWVGSVGGVHVLVHVNVIAKIDINLCKPKICVAYSKVSSAFL